MYSESQPPGRGAAAGRTPTVVVALGRPVELPHPTWAPAYRRNLHAATPGAWSPHCLATRTLIVVEARCRPPARAIRSSGGKSLRRYSMPWCSLRARVSFASNLNISREGIAHTRWKKTCFPRSELFAQVPSVTEFIIQLDQFNFIAAL